MGKNEQIKTTLEEGNLVRQDSKEPGKDLNKWLWRSVEESHTRFCYKNRAEKPGVPFS